MSSCLCVCCSNWFNDNDNVEIAVSAGSVGVKPAKRFFIPLDALTPVEQSDDAIDVILRMVPTSAYKTLVVFRDLLHFRNLALSNHRPRPTVDRRLGLVREQCR